MRFLVNIDVDDVEKAAAFYGAALGLKTGRRFGDDGIELLGGSSAIYLLRKKPGSAPFQGSDLSREYGRHWTPVHLDFAVDNVDEVVARAVSAGARLEGAIEDRAWGRLARMSDPFGHGFCILQFTGKGYDAIAENA